MALIKATPKSLEQDQKIPKFVVVQQKIGEPWKMLKIEPNIICKINKIILFYTFSYFSNPYKIPKKGQKF